MQVQGFEIPRGIPAELQCAIRYFLERYMGVKPTCSFTRFLDDGGRAVFRHIPPGSWKRLVAILYNNVYVAPIFDRDLVHGHVDLYVIGLYGFNKLFMHAFNNHHVAYPDWLYDAVKEFETTGRVVIRRINVSDVRHFLGFNLDAEFDLDLDILIKERIKRGEEVFVRAQGDLILGIFPMEFNEYVNRLASGDVARVVHVYCTQRVLNELDSLGISYNVDSLSRLIEVPIGGKTRVATRLMDKLLGHLRERIQGCEISGGYDGRRGYIEFNIGDENPHYNRLLQEVADKLMHVKGEYQLTFGRHVVKYVGWPQDTLVVLDDPIIGKVALYLSDILNGVFMERVMITHPEHDAFYFDFGRPVYVRFSFVNNWSVDVDNLERLARLFPLDG